MEEKESELANGIPGLAFGGLAMWAYVDNFAKTDWGTKCAPVLDWSEESQDSITWDDENKDSTNWEDTTVVPIPTTNRC